MSEILEGDTEMFGYQITEEEMKAAYADRLMVFQSPIPKISRNDMIQYRESWHSKPPQDELIRLMDRGSVWSMAFIFGSAALWVVWQGWR